MQENPVPFQPLLDAINLSALTQDYHHFLRLVHHPPGKIIILTFQYLILYIILDNISVLTDSSATGCSLLSSDELKEIS